jgi:hypothetical protein
LSAPSRRDTLDCTIRVYLLFHDSHRDSKNSRRGKLGSENVKEAKNKNPSKLILSSSPKAPTPSTHPQISGEQGIAACCRHGCVRWERVGFCRGSCRRRASSRLCTRTQDDQRHRRWKPPRKSQRCASPTPRRIRREYLEDACPRRTITHPLWRNRFFRPPNPKLYSLNPKP